MTAPDPTLDRLIARVATAPTPLTETARAAILARVTAATAAPAVVPLGSRSRRPALAAIGVTLAIAAGLALWLGSSDDHTTKGAGGAGTGSHMPARGSGSIGAGSSVSAGSDVPDDAGAGSSVSAGSGSGTPMPSPGSGRRRNRSFGAGSGSSFGAGSGARPPLDAGLDADLDPAAPPPE